MHARKRSQIAIALKEGAESSCWRMDSFETLSTSACLVNRTHSIPPLSIAHVFTREDQVSYQFNARQTATVRLRGDREQVQMFLQEPQHLIAALLDRDRVMPLDERQFEVRMRPIGALGMTIQPVVQLDIHAEADGRVLLRALGCRIEGNDWVDRRFNLEFQGELTPARVFTDASGAVTILSGVADLNVTIDLPPVLRFTPYPVVQKVGTTITQGILATLQRSLSKRLPERFTRWVQSRSVAPVASKLARRPG